MTSPVFLTQTYGGYYHRDVPEEDAELTHVAPGSPAGEWLRRFWHPIAHSHELKDLPIRLRILGEDLVVFRDLRGHVGLLELHCSHRGTSLEFGMIEENGIRCCYHGWLFGVDGRILDTPGEPFDSTYKARLCHGAYHVHERVGLVWAYMGPPHKKPPFPEYDTYCMPGYRLEHRKYVKPCNYLQGEDNIMDPLHLTTLHVLSSGLQFYSEDGGPVPEFGIFAELDWIETPLGIVYVASRRVGDDVWVRMGEWIAPNHRVVPAHPSFPPRYPNGQSELYIPPKFTSWSVPIDDTSTLSFDIMHVPEDKKLPAIATNEGTIMRRPRTYEDRQRHPGDYEAQSSQRSIAIHGLEHLGATDRGITMLRKKIRENIRAVMKGQDPDGLYPIEAQLGKVIPTYSGDTVLNIPPAPTKKEDQKLLRQTGRMLAERYLQCPPNLSVQG
jgi:nitrite reductase/ring-hydroxylating ferredoxin subunit